MNDLKLKNKQNVAFPFNDIDYDDEWIIEEGHNIEVKKTQVEGDGENVDLPGASLNDPTQDGQTLDLDNIVC